MRSALDKTSTLGYAQSCIPTINDLYQHFITYLRRSRDKDGFIDDIDRPLKMLLVEGEKFEVECQFSLKFCIT